MNLDFEIKKARRNGYRAGVRDAWKLKMIAHENFRHPEDAINYIDTLKKLRSKNLRRAIPRKRFDR